MTVAAANSTIVYQDGNGVIFVDLGDGNGNLEAYALPSWQSFLPKSPIVVYGTLGGYIANNPQVPPLEASVADIDSKMTTPLGGSEPVYQNDPYTYSYTWSNGLLATKTRTYNGVSNTKTYTWNSSSQLISISAWV